MQTHHACIKGGLFTGFLDGFFYISAFIFKHFFDMCWVDPPIRVIRRSSARRAISRRTEFETRNRNRFRCVVNDDIRPSGLLKSANIAAVSANDTPLHLFVWQNDR